MKIVPILISLIISYIVAIIFTVTGVRDLVDFSSLNGKSILGFPPFAEFTPFQASKGVYAFDISAIITCCVVSLAAMIEHIGDIAAISQACSKNFIEDPGVERTLLGDGLATSLAGILGGPANTTYSENTGVIVLTNVIDPLVIKIAAGFSILLSFSPMFDALISTVPACIIGGISFVLYGMISAVGMRTVVDQKVDFSKMKNILIVAIIMVSGLGFNAHPIRIGSVQFSGLACAAIFGVLANIILSKSTE